MARGRGAVQQASLRRANAINLREEIATAVVERLFKCHSVRFVSHRGCQAILDRGWLRALWWCSCKCGSLVSRDRAGEGDFSMNRALMLRRIQKGLDT